MVRAADASQVTVDPQMMLPDLLGRHPQARAVFDRYGLHGCGGRLGPVESIRFFARAHGVDEARLLRELQEATAPGSGGAVATAPPSIADTIYRRFFAAGIAIILTAGATWGAMLLWRIGLAGTFTGVSVHEVNAHGHAQIAGWVGLFIMGFAYQAFPRMWHTTLVAPRLAGVAFVAMLLGIGLRTTAMTLATTWPAAALAAMIGAAVELFAVLLFAGQLAWTFRRSGAAVEPYVGFAFAALAWFAVQTLADGWHTWNTMTAPTRDALLAWITTYQAPLRDLQIHGMALFMVLGVSLRMLPALFGVPRTGDRRAWWALGVLLAAVVGEVTLFVAWRRTGLPTLAGLIYAMWILLAVGVAMVALPWRLWRPMPQSDRTAKFVRAAYAWLAASLLMLLLLPAHQRLTGIEFSHAYYGAIRHAITVGFISMMIMGFAAKVVPTLNGIDLRGLSPLWGPFVLINLGCFLRVTMQALTDAHPAFFGVVGISGTLEVTALAWWGVGLVAIMRRGKAEAIDEVSAPLPTILQPHHRVAQVLAWFPATAEVFDRLGFAPLRNPVMRRTVARVTSLAQAAALRGVPLDMMLDSLNNAAGLSRTRPTSPSHVRHTPVVLTIGASA